MNGKRTEPTSNDAQGVWDQAGGGLRLVAHRIGNIIGTKVLFLVQIWLALSIPARATTQPAQDHGLVRRIESDLSREKRAYETFESKERRLIETFSDLEKAAKDIEQEIEKLNHQIDFAESDIKGLSEKLTALEMLLKETQDRVVGRMVALYKHARKGYMKGLFDAEDLMDLRQRAKYASAVIQEDQEELAVWASIGQKGRSDIMATKGRLRETIAKRDASKELRTQLREELDGTVVRLMNVHREKEFYETGVKELELAAKGMSQAITGLTQRDDGYRGDSTRRFADLKGHLPRPMDGRMVSGPKGKGIGSESAFQRGIFFESAANQEVKAVFTGRVDFSGKLKGYGETIIVNHGDRFFTIYAFLAHRIKHMGESVSQGEVIGRVGTPQDQFDRRLYFEIRESDKALGPNGWFERQ
jgi:septal ring factor EnvC (AmiA/AmiB activator)